jgi:hypothetical protein
MVEPLRHRQTKEAATDMFDLKQPRHTSTLLKFRVHSWGHLARSGSIVMSNQRCRFYIEKTRQGFLVLDAYDTEYGRFSTQDQAEQAVKELVADWGVLAVARLALRGLLVYAVGIIVLFAIIAAGLLLGIWASLLVPGALIGALVVFLKMKFTKRDE